MAHQLSRGDLRNGLHVLPCYRKKKQFFETAQNHGAQMSIRLLVKFTVVEDQAETLVGILQGAKSILLNAPGCEAVEVLHSVDDPSKVILSEVWQSREIHDRYAATTDAESSKKLVPILKREPEVEIFDIK